MSGGCGNMLRTLAGLAAVSAISVVVGGCVYYPDYDAYGYDGSYPASGYATYGTYTSGYPAYYYGGYPYSYPYGYPYGYAAWPAYGSVWLGYGCCGYRGYYGYRGYHGYYGGPRYYGYRGGYGYRGYGGYGASRGGGRGGGRGWHR